MLGSVPFSTKALGDDIILLAGVGEMSGLGVQTSVGVGTLVGVIDLSANLTQTSTATFISSGSNVELSGNMTQTSASIRVFGSTFDIGLTPNFTQETTGTGTFLGASTQSFDLTQTSTGDLLFTQIQPSVTVTWTEATHSGDTWTETTHSGDTWTEVAHSGDTWTEVTHTGDTWTDTNV